MLRLLIDENFNERILRGLNVRVPTLDFVSVKEIGLKRAKDSDLLKWAAVQNRAILTHDIKTLVPDAKRMVQLGQSMAGVILVPKRLAIGRAIEDLELLVKCLEPFELRDSVRYIPL